MLTRLDPHSDYMDEQEFKESEADINGKFGGLGIQISEEHGVPKVISPIDGTPAAHAGLQPGDLIVGIDGASAQGMDLSKVVRVLRGDPGTSVKLTIARGTEKPFDVSITRAIIEVQTVKSHLAPDGIGYVRISEFGGDTPRDFKQAVEKLKQDAGGKLKGLVLDLRNDPGGLLAAAVAVAGNFLDGGTVVTIKGRQQRRQSRLRRVRQRRPHSEYADCRVDQRRLGLGIRDRRRRPAGPPPRQDHGHAELRQGLGADHHPAQRPRRAAADHRALLHARRPLDPGPGHRAGHRGRGAQGPAGRGRVHAARELAERRFPQSGVAAAQAQTGRERQGGAKEGAPTEAETFSAPIKTQVIGTPEDAQLKAALGYIQKAPGSTAGRG